MIKSISQYYSKIINLISKYVHINKLKCVVENSENLKSPER